ncbi:hypothetical protein HYPSUDRAFT_371713 [Hypholoma sublateritium FD-334 SS-4]|uniref:Uncharacterized protein n=1 Tax=Hypholoma sublateritium (strain FD-334 SS-4) TaxID=945553 RepID=A0A0D2KLB4_HYPSF|nr:hypothetical protein HYPSUDRAFT_371713 [Hypholoma sublateritium FD-334 SS-4]
MCMFRSQWRLPGDDCTPSTRFGEVVFPRLRRFPTTRQRIARRCSTRFSQCTFHSNFKTYSYSIHMRGSFCFHHILYVCSSPLFAQSHVLQHRHRLGVGVETF